MILAKASIDVPLSAPDAAVAWTDFEGFHTFLVDPSPESFDDVCLRVAAKFSRGTRPWSQLEIKTAHGLLLQWRGPAREAGTSLVKLEPLENGETRVRVEILPILHGGVEAGVESIRRTSKRLQADLEIFHYWVRMKQWEFRG